MFRFSLICLLLIGQYCISAPIPRHLIPKDERRTKAPDSMCDGVYQDLQLRYCYYSLEGQLVKGVFLCPDQSPPTEEWWEANKDRVPRYGGWKVDKWGTWTFHPTKEN